ncbi:G-protein coupled receptor Mth2, partial [Stegodyphus mimosarum]
MDIMNTILFLTLYTVFLAALSHAVNETVEGNNEIFRNKHPSLHNCPSFELGPDEYILYPNGTIYVESYNKTYNESFYFLKDNTVTICVPDNPYPNTDYENENEKELENEYEYANNLKYLSQIGLSISMVCLVLHLLVFVLVPALRNLPGYNLASLCFSLFICYLFSIFTDSENLSKNRNMCIATAVLIQYFFMASFLWMSVIAFDVYRALLQATGNLRVSNMQFTLKKYGFYCIFSWGISLVFTSAALIADNANGIDELYKPQFERNCWFRYKESLLVFFAGPIFVMIISNLIIFFLSVYTIFSNRMKSDESSNKMLLKKQALLYFRLAVIMG